MCKRDSTRLGADFRVGRHSRVDHIISRGNVTPIKSRLGHGRSLAAERTILTNSLGMKIATAGAQGASTALEPGWRSHTVEPHLEEVLMLEAGLAFTAALLETDLTPSTRGKLAVSLSAQIRAADDAGSASGSALKRLASELFFSPAQLFNLCLEGKTNDAMLYVRRFATPSQLMAESSIRFAFKLYVHWATTMLREGRPEDVAAVVNDEQDLHCLLERHVPGHCVQVSMRSRVAKTRAAFFNPLLTHVLACSPAHENHHSCSQPNF